MLLPYESPVAGVVLAVELKCGSTVEVFRADDCQFYFCHGLTFGGVHAPGGPVSPFSGRDIQTILDNYYARVDPESQAVAGNILVWHGLDPEKPHSAILILPVITQGANLLDDDTLLRSKNGKMAESEYTLFNLTDGPNSYGESYNVYRRT
jgi:hypothetical protein